MIWAGVGESQKQTFLYPQGSSSWSNKVTWDRLAGENSHYIYIETPYAWESQGPHLQDRFRDRETSSAYKTPQGMDDVMHLEVFEVIAG